MFLWGFTGVLGRLITLNEGLLVWYRLLITIIILFGVSRLYKNNHRLPWTERSKLFGIGAIVALHWVLFYGSIKYANVSIALTCLSSGGLFTAFFEPLLFKKKMSLFEVLLGGLGVAGIYLIFHFDPRYQTGVIVGILSSIMSVIFSLLNKKAIVSIPARSVMFYELTGGFIVLTVCMPLYLLYFPPTHILPTTEDWGWLFLLSSFCTVLAMDISLQALKYISVFTQNLTLNLEPVYGILLAFIIYHENKSLGPTFYLGFSLILLAVVIQMIRMLGQIRRVKRNAP